MRQSESVGKFGEYFVALMFQNWGFETDMVDAEGIDLMCYRNLESKNEKYGVSVKTRNPYNKKIPVYY